MDIFTAVGLIVVFGGGLYLLYRHNKKKRLLGGSGSKPIEKRKVQ